MTKKSSQKSQVNYQNKKRTDRPKIRKNVKVMTLFFWADRKSSQAMTFRWLDLTFLPTKVSKLSLNWSNLTQISPLCSDLLKNQVYFEKNLKNFRKSQVKSSKSQSHDFDFLLQKKSQVMTWLFDDLTWLFPKKMTFRASLSACNQNWIWFNFIDTYRKALNPSAAPQASFKLKCMHLTPYFSSKLL